MVRPFPSVDGPTFLPFFLVLEVLTIIAAEVYVRRTEPKPTREPELFEWAWLNGGEAAVLTTSNLLEDRFAYTYEAQNPRPLYRRALNDPLHGLAQLARGNTNSFAARNAPVSPIGPYLEALEQGAHLGRIPPRKAWECGAHHLVYFHPSPCSWVSGVAWLAR